MVGVSFQALMTGAAAAAVTSLSQIASTTSSNSATVTGSASIVAGDLLVLLDAVWNLGANPPASSVPTGFTSIVTSSLGTANATRATLSFKIATGAEASASITGMTGTGGASKILTVFRGNVAITSASALDPEQTSTDANPAALTVNASSGTPPLVVVAGYSSSAAVNPRTFTVGGSAAKDGEQNGTGTLLDDWLAWKIYNSSPADVVIDMDDEGLSNTLVAAYIQCA